MKTDKNKKYRIIGYIIIIPLIILWAWVIFLLFSPIFISLYHDLGF